MNYVNPKSNFSFILEENIENNMIHAWINIVIIIKIL